jgi:hypothetical protein
LVSHVARRQRRAVLCSLAIAVALLVPRPHLGAVAARGARAYEAFCKLIAIPRDSFTRVPAPAAADTGLFGPQAATITVTYSGFTQAAQDAFQRAVDIWKTQPITSQIPITVQASFSSLPADTLGTASYRFAIADPANAPIPNTFYPLPIANAVSGTDNDAGVDITATFNSTFSNWYFGTDANTPLGQYDFVSVVLHELGHGLGFSGSLRVNGSGAGSWGAQATFNGPVLPFVFDRFVVNGSGQQLIDTNVFANPGGALAAQITSDNLFWNGINGVSANGSVRPKLYAPATYEPGSSVDHLDDGAFPAGDANSLMTHAIGTAEAIHDPGPITRGILRDSGWPTCIFSLSPTSATIAQGGAAGSVTVTATAGCAWTAVSNNTGFLTITSGASGTGNGTVNYSVTANTGGARTGTMTIAGQTFTITQPGPCSFTLTPTSASVGASSGSGNVAVTVTPSTCSWTAASNSSFIGVTGGSSGTGNGTVSYSFTANTGAARTGTLTIGGLTFTLSQSAALMTLDRTTLNFAAVNNGGTLTNATAAQTVRVNFTGAPPTWTATPTVAASQVPWLQITGGSGTGNGSFSVGVTSAAGLPASGTLTATIQVVSGGAANTPQLVAVRLTLISPTTTTAAPFGSFDTPAPGTVRGSVAVTGWALDDIEVVRVEIWRDVAAGETTPPFNSPGHPGHGKIYIADALFVAGARSDVESAFPNSPLAYRAGWGYLLLTWGLFNQGMSNNFTLYAFAYDREGKFTTLGSKAITSSNGTATRPFGSIDTPAIGEVTSASFFNFGWALTPNANAADLRSCTITNGNVFVAIDSGPLMPVAYGDNRTDIAGAFPGFSNGANGGGHFLVDTTAIANGTHAIGWFVTDSCGRSDGIGSRFFTVAK